MLAEHIEPPDIKVQIPVLQNATVIQLVMNLCNFLGNRQRLQGVVADYH